MGDRAGAAHAGAGIRRMLALVMGLWLAGTPHESRAQAIPGPVTLSTAVGEVRTFADLPGWKVTLDGRTRVVVDRRGSQPSLQLLEGAVFIEPMPGTMPGTMTTLAVEAPAWQLVVSGAVELCTQGSRLDVAVRMGSARIAPKGAGKTVWLGASKAVSYDGVSAYPVRAVTGARIGSWVDGAYAFESAPLLQILDALSRRYDHTYVVDDPALGRATVSMIVSRQVTHAEVLATLAQALSLRTFERPGNVVAITAAAARAKK